MHQGGGERFYKRFAREAKQKGAKTLVYCAEKQGDKFFYQDGKIKRKTGKEMIQCSFYPMIVRKKGNRDERA